MSIMNSIFLETKQSHRRRSTSRRGAVAVEFAFVAPVLVAILFGLVELSRVFETQNLLEISAREGARLASMDREGLLSEGETTNQRVSRDVKNFLASNGLDADGVQVSVKDAENPEADFDLDDPANDLRLFEVHVSIDYSDVSYTSVPEEYDYTLTSKVTFRNGRATISE
jgi:Flp pilus assembly protein TadG